MKSAPVSTASTPSVPNPSPMTPPTYLVSSAFIATKEDERRFSQVRGKSMDARFVSNRVNLVYVRGNGETVYFLRNRKTLFLQSNEGEDNGISFQDRHGKIAESPRNCSSTLLGHINIHPRHRIRTICIENNPRKLNDFFFLLILSHKILAAEKKSSQQNKRV